MNSEIQRPEDDLSHEKKFLDTKLEDGENGIYTFSVNRRKNKYPMHWSSKVPKRYKRNAILGDLHRAKRISADFKNEKELIKQKFISAGFPLRFVDSVVRDFQDEEPDIQPAQPNDERILYRIKLPFCEANEKLTSKFFERLNYFTGDVYKFFVVWQTRKIRSLFPHKDEKIHRICVIYKGECNCGEAYIGETERNDIIRFNEHEDRALSSEPARHLKENNQHQFTWSIIRNASRNQKIRKIVEAFFIMAVKPSLNRQLEKPLTLFRYGMT